MDVIERLAITVFGLVCMIVPTAILTRGNDCRICSNNIGGFFFLVGVVIVLYVSYKGGRD